MSGTGAWGVAASDLRSRIDVPLKMEVGRNEGLCRAAGQRTMKRRTHSISFF
jgi:hypothetical protein